MKTERLLSPAVTTAVVWPPKRRTIFMLLPMTLAAVWFPWAVVAEAQVVDPALPGPFTTGQTTINIPVGLSGTLETEVFFPSDGNGGVEPAAGECPVVAFGHGFNRSISRYRDTVEHLASRGFVVLLGNHVCNILGGCDHSANADEMIDLLDWIVARNADSGSVFFQRIATDQLGTTGHSAGGLQALVAAARDPRIVASAPMDPVDNDGLGVSELPTASAAITVLLAEPSSCNSNGSASDLFTAANAPKTAIKVIGSSHCDPEDDNDFLGCALFCGAWQEARHAIYLASVTAWFEYHLHCNEEYRPWVSEAEVEAGVSAGQITYTADLAPAAPLGVSASWHESGAVISRQIPTRCVGVDFWRVYRSGSPGGPSVLVGDQIPITDLEWIDDTVVPGSDVVYVVRDVAIDFLGEYEGESSIETSPSEIDEIIFSDDFEGGDLSAW